MYNYQKILNQYLKKKQKKNPRFSKRALARFIGISPSQLCALLNGKREISYKHALLISKKLNISSVKKNLIIQDVVSKITNSLNETQIERVLTSKEFKSISTWYHIAILELANIANEDANAKWFAERLNISQTITNEAINKLINLGFLKSDGFRIYTTGQAFITDNNIPQKTLQSYHKSIINLSLEKLTKTPPELKVSSSSILRIPTSKIHEIDEMITDFQRKLGNILEKSENVDELYACSIQFFPLTSMAKNQ